MACLVPFQGSLLAILVEHKWPVSSCLLEGARRSIAAAFSAGSSTSVGIQKPRRATPTFVPAPCAPNARVMFCRHQRQKALD